MNLNTTSFSCPGCIIQPGNLSEPFNNVWAVCSRRFRRRQLFKHLLLSNLKSRFREVFFLFMWWEHSHWILHHGRWSGTTSRVCHFPLKDSWCRKKPRGLLGWIWLAGTCHVTDLTVSLKVGKVCWHIQQSYWPRRWEDRVAGHVPNSIVRRKQGMFWNMQ